MRGLGQHGVHPLNEHLRLGRFHQKGIRSHVQRQFRVLGFGVGRGVNHERNAMQRRVSLPFTQQGVSVHHRHQQVTDHQIRGTCARPLQRLLTLHRLFHLKAMPLHQHAQQVAVVLPVIDDQHTHQATPLMKRSTSSANVCGSMGFSM